MRKHLHVFAHIFLTSQCPSSSSVCCHRKVGFVATLQNRAVPRTFPKDDTLPVRGSGASPCPALHLPPVQEAAGGSRRMMSGLSICSVGARAVLRGSSARFSPPSSPLLSFGLLLPGFATPVPSLARRCPGCFSLPGCSRVAPLLCKLTLCRVPLLTPSRFVPSCAIPSSPQPARSVPFPRMMDGGAAVRASGGASACPAPCQDL